MSFFEIATLVIVQNTMLFARNTVFEKLPREAWSVTCRAVFFAWFISLWVRAESQCSTSVAGQKQYLLGVVPMPSISLLVERFGAQNCIPYDVVWFLLAQILFYITELIWLTSLPLAKRRKDDRVFEAHHWLTLTAIGSALATTPLYWAAAFVLSLHDVSDLLLDVAVLLRAQYKATKRDIYDFFSSCFFYAFVAVWFVTRVHYIPAHVILPLWPLPQVHGIASYVFLALQVPQAFWTAMIVRAVWRSIFATGGKIKDEREEE